MEGDWRDIEKGLRKALENFGLYETRHWIQVVVKNKKICIAYAPSGNRAENFYKTRFDIEMIGDLCNINGFFIESEKRRRGYGRNLYNLIEDFCFEEFGCNKFVTSASGQGVYFWSKMGFNSKKGIEVEKILV